MFKILSGVILIGAVIDVAIYASTCPCERMPGLWLGGEEVTEQQEDWSFVNNTGLCELEVRSWRPHSITLNCMSADKALYISCSRCDGKYWSGVALENPAAKIRIDGKVYPVALRRLIDDNQLDIAWLARATKLGRENVERPDHWWSFELTSR